MATMLLCSCLLKLSSEYLFLNICYRQKYYFLNLIYYINSCLKINLGYLFKQCDLLNSGKYKIEHKISTVAAYVNEPDLVTANETNNFEYDDSEWDVGIGNLIINLDADIEKTQEKLNLEIGMASTPTSSSSNHRIQNSENLSCSCIDNTSFINNVQISSSLSSSSIVSSTVTNINTINQNLSSITSATNILQVTVNSCKTNCSSSTSETSHSGKMAIEHSSTVDKGLKMKIKRTKSGTKSSEAKHEIVKSNEVNSSLSNQDGNAIVSSSSISNSLLTITMSQGIANTVETLCSSTSNKLKSSSIANTNPDESNTTFISSKKVTGAHRREKCRDKHEKLQNNHVPQLAKLEVSGSTKQITQNHATSVAVSTATTVTSVNFTTPTLTTTSTNDQIPISNTFTNSTNTSLSCTEANSNQSMSLVSNNISQPQVQGSILAVSSVAHQTNANNNEISNCSSTISLSSMPKLCSTDCTEQRMSSANTSHIHSASEDEILDNATNSPPAKKLKCLSDSNSQGMTDASVGTSIGTITEPDCLGPCEPGTSVTLEGIVWHETEGGVLVVNITWRGKTYVGTLLDCTRHDWAPPRFCDSPTSDMDSRTKGRSKRGRVASNLGSNNDLSNFTETRSSVHSKLRNNVSKGRRGAHGSPASSPCSASFISPRADLVTKRKTKYSDEDEKSKRKIPPSTTSSAYTSPPASPLLLECPEPTCSKKYKHINGLKYHQSHAHGSIDDEDAKDIMTSMSENDESNIEAPSPATPTKSPSGKTDNAVHRLISPTTNLLEPLSTESSLVLHVTLPEIDIKPSIISDNNDVKSTILKFDNKENHESVNPLSPPLQASQIHTTLENKIFDNESANFLLSHVPIANDTSLTNNNSSKQFITNTTSSPLPHQIKSATFSANFPSQIRQSIPEKTSANELSSESITCLLREQTNTDLQDHSENQSPNTQIEDQELDDVNDVLINQHNTLQNLSEPTSSKVSTSNDIISSTILSVQNIQPHLHSFSNINLQAKIPQFKVKPTSALMPEQDKNRDLKIPKTANLKKKLRKSSTSSPHESSLETITVETGRDDVQSPAYSDISDDANPSAEVESCDKLLKHTQEKELKTDQQNHLTTHFSMYPYFGQPSYLIQNIPDKSSHDSKITDSANKSDLKSLNIVSIPAITNLQNFNLDKDKKELASSQISSQLQTHYYANYNTYMSAGYPFQTQPENSLNQLSESEYFDQKHQLKQETQVQNVKEKQNENQQLLKESIEVKRQMSPYQLYHGSQTQRPSPIPAIVADDKKYFVYTGEQRRKEESHKQTTSQKVPPPSPKLLSKQDKLQDINKNDETKIKHEGVKPTMETQGPPPPPTSQYAYIHPGYIPSHHYGGISYDPSHPGMYRNLAPMIVPGTYTSNPYLHQLPRYHAPEDLSRSPGGKALDLLQHHANQYYSAHKIHELQDRALKSPTLKPLPVSSSPLSTGPPISIRSPSNSTNNTSGSCLSSQIQSTSSKQQSHNISQHQSTCGDTNTNSLSKDNRSPPPQRHVHTHHHTHVGLGYPILPGQYPPPYGDFYNS